MQMFWQMKETPAKMSSVRRFNLISASGNFYEHAMEIIRKECKKNEKKSQGKHKSIIMLLCGELSRILFRILEKSEQHFQGCTIM